ncbi:MAG TPA: pilus assembly protein N-terminal domain-containing protein [Pirellulaceae bacterium]|nr:pilus assembly protein N-terminal domain-containing protein [Pirellulaceae bacterium]
MLLACAGWTQSASAQPQPQSRPEPLPPPEPLTSGFQPHLPVIPSRVAPSAERFSAASSFIESLSRNDAMFEVVLGQGRMLVLKEDLAPPAAPADANQPLIAVGNPGVIDFQVLGPRHIRLIGKRIGVTDLVVTTVDQKSYSYQVHVVYDLNLVQARIRELMPDAQVRVAQIGKNLVVEGQARDAAQIRQIMELVSRGVLVDAPATSNGATDFPEPGQPAAPQSMLSAGGMAEDVAATGPEIINLLRVPGPQQVLLKVQIAELNRTALRQIGADILYADGGTILGTKLNGITTSASVADASGLFGTAATEALGSSPTTAFGIFNSAGLQVMLSALRQNSVLKILAEPNLVAMNGHEARFLAGGEFPVPVPQSGAGGGAPTITVQYKKFGVQLNFIPYIMDDDVIRLSVDPEVSSIDFGLGIQLSGTSVPGLNTRNAHTVVELREGQTLAIAGLMQMSLTHQNTGIPGLGDLPYIGPFFSNNTGNRVEKELVVLVTPYLVESMHPDEVPPRPGDEVVEPNDLEFYLLGRLQGRTGQTEFRSTTNADDPLHLMRRMKLESRCIQGPLGFSE